MAQGQGNSGHGGSGPGHIGAGSGKKTVSRRQLHPAIIEIHRKTPKIVRR